MTKKMKEEIKKKLLEALLSRNAMLKRFKEKNLKTFETEFQDVIEKIFPDKSWYDVTNCKIFEHLLAFKDPMKTCFAIAEGLKHEA